MSSAKYTPHYELSVLQATVAEQRVNSFTGSALKGVSELDMSVDQAVELIGYLTPVNFYKSMPSANDPDWFQDVYHLSYQDTVLYIKLTNYLHGTVVISFKER